MTQLQEKTHAQFASRGSTHYDLILALMCVVLILSNIGASKGVAFGPILTDGGFFLFPLAYILGDVVSEVYGFRAARRAILMGFAMAVFAALTFWIIISLPAADFYTNQDALASVLGPVPLVVLGSLLGFLAGQTLNSWVLVRMKERTKEKHLWARLMTSTGVGEFVDTLIFCAIAASVIGITTAGDFVNYVIVGFAYKTAVEFLFVPITSTVIKAIKKREPSYGVVSA